MPTLAGLRNPSRERIVAISIVLADGNAIVRRGLQALFDSEPEIAVVGIASNGPHAIRLAERLKPEVLVIDLMTPGVNGLAALRHLRKRVPQIRTVVFSMYHSSAFVSEALKNGATGYVYKGSCEENLVHAVKEASEGRRFLSPPAPENVVRLYAERSKTNPHETLTRRQREILQLTAEGKTSTQSAAALKISPRTVENHRAMLMERLGLSNHTDLIRHAIRHGLIPLDDMGR
jgi:two-component system, NarL family, response regulator NreC